MKNIVNAFDDEKALLEYSMTVLDQLNRLGGIVRIDFAYLYALAHRCRTSYVIESEFDVSASSLLDYVEFCKTTKTGMPTEVDGLLVVCLPGTEDDIDQVQIDNLEFLVESLEDALSMKMRFFGAYRDPERKANTIKTVLVLCSTQSRTNDERGQG